MKTLTLASAAAAERTVPCLDAARRQTVAPAALRPLTAVAAVMPAGMPAFGLAAFGANHRGIACDVVRSSGRSWLYTPNTTKKDHSQRERPT